MTFRIRPFAPEDLDLIYHISLVTGAAGRDATPDHHDKRLIGHIWSAPYAVLEPELAFVAEDSQGVAGFVVGTADTDRFEKMLCDAWWPKLRARYAGLMDTNLRAADIELIGLINTPSKVPHSVRSVFPAHLHMNSLPRLRGKGAGRALLESWENAAIGFGVSKAHIGAHADNQDGIAFWRAMGFEELSTAQGGPYFGKTLQAAR